MSEKGEQTTKYYDTCFVIQPFNEKFNKRYEDIFKPAIVEAGLTPYRVDKDYRVRSIIDSITENIEISKICFADITLDNPNVWFEVGFAFAKGKNVIMSICENEQERENIPLDIGHRNVIFYKSESISDFEKLKQAITKFAEAYRRIEEKENEDKDKKKSLTDNKSIDLAGTCWERNIGNDFIKNMYRLEFDTNGAYKLVVRDKLSLVNTSTYSYDTNNNKIKLDLIPQPIDAEVISENEIRIFLFAERKPVVLNKVITK
jgi:hypothetical protein